MCGISGILGRDALEGTRDALYRMMASLRHRGPDESGAYFGEGAALGHTRLSIIGLDDGTQPIGNEDGSLWIVYNGETFNYRELRRELEARGHRFSTSTDTEVVLHLYEEQGKEALHRINGQFALAIWDRRKRELFLARDRVGIRPLFHTRCGGRFLFASEIKALFQVPGVPRELDPRSLAQTFVLWTTLAPRTPFREIRELPPGHYLRVQGERIVEEGRWWSPPYFSPGERWEGSLAEAQEELHALLSDAVRLRLRADVPVGAYLSGGLDSSIITALMAVEVQGPLQTYGMGFEEGAFDETSYQREMVRWVGAQHRPLRIANEEIRDHFAACLWHGEKPLLRTSPVPLMLLSRAVRQSGLKVVLTGEGADEIFGGYNIFKEAKIRAFWARQPRSRRRPLLLERLYPYIFQHASPGRSFLREFFAVSEADRADPFVSHRVRWRNGRRNLLLLSDEARLALEGYDPLAELLEKLPPDFARRGNLDRAMLLEQEMFLSHYLLCAQGDRVAMANSVEVRLPYLDARVMEFAARLPAHWKIRGLNEKYLLKRAFREQLPPSIARRGKQPYRAPIREAFFGGGGDPLTEHALCGDALRRTGLFHPGRVDFLLKQFAGASAAPASESRNMALTGVASAQILQHLFVDDFRPETRAPRPMRVIDDLPVTGSGMALSCA